MAHTEHELDDSATGFSGMAYSEKVVLVVAESTKLSGFFCSLLYSFRSSYAVVYPISECPLTNSCRPPGSAAAASQFPMMRSSASFQILLRFCAEVVLGLTLYPHCKLIRVPFVLLKPIIVDFLLKVLQGPDLGTLMLINYGGPCW